MTLARGTIPLPIWRMIEHSRKERAKLDTGDFSVTELQRPAYMAWLWRQHPDLEEDPETMLAALRGVAWHAYMQAANVDKDHTIAEQRLGLDIADPATGKLYRVTGGSDVYYQDDDGAWVLADAKDVSVWSVIYGDSIPDWSWQLQSYRQLWLEAGFTPDRLRQLVTFKDWRAGQALASSDYPQHHWMTWDVDPRTPQEVHAYLLSRIQAHTQNPPIPCSSKEMWERPPGWAVLGPDSTRARRVCATEAEARALLRPSEWAVVRAEGGRALKKFDNPVAAGTFAADRSCIVEERPSGDRVEFRPGDRVRCTGGAGGRPFCPVASVCPVKAAWLAVQGRSE